MSSRLRALAALTLGSCVALALGLAGLRSTVVFFLKREAQHSLEPATSVIKTKLGERNTPAQLCILGDSRAAEWSSFPGEEVLNLGIPGATTVEIAGAIASLGSQRLGEIVVIQCGINDLKSLPYDGRPIDEASDLVSSTVIQLALTQIERGAAQVVVTGIFPTGPVPLQRRPFWSSQIEEARIRANSALELAALQQDFVYVDTDFVLSDKELFRDALHLTEDGYRALNSSLELQLPANE